MKVFKKGNIIKNKTSTSQQMVVGPSQTKVFLLAIPLYRIKKDNPGNL